MAERAAVAQQTARSTAIQGNPAATTPRFVEPQAVYNRLNELYDAIARRAFEMFEGDGSAAGRDLDHWFRAEAELLHPVHVRCTKRMTRLRCRPRFRDSAPMSCR